MAWKLSTKPQTYKVTHRLALEFAEMEKAPGDRPLNAARFATLKALYEKGEFRSCLWASAHCKETGKTYRVNGKHSSLMLSQMNGKLRNDLFATVERYECDTQKDIAGLYATFDSAKSARRVCDINRSFAGTDPQLEGIRSRIIDIGITGIAYSKWEYNLNSHPVEERAQLMFEHKPFFLWLAGLLETDNQDSRNIRRQGVVAAMFLTWQKSAKAATGFWSLVRDASGPVNTSPDRKLHKWLSSVSICSVARDRIPGAKAREIVNNRQMMVRSLHAWNAWREGEDTDLRYYADKPIPPVK